MRVFRLQNQKAAAAIATAAPTPTPTPTPIATPLDEPPLPPVPLAVADGAELAAAVVGPADEEVAVAVDDGVEVWVWVKEVFPMMVTVKTSAGDSFDSNVSNPPSQLQPSPQQYLSEVVILQL